MGTELEEVGLQYATRLVNSGPVVLISAAYAGEMGVMTLAWNMPVRKSPPLIAIDMGERHHTTGLLHRSGEFIINIPGWDVLDLVKYCGTVSGHKENKFDSGRFGWESGKVTQAPLLNGMLGILECKEMTNQALGTHNIILGEVRRCATRIGCFDETWNIQKGKCELVHHLGGPDFYPSSIQS